MTTRDMQKAAVFLKEAKRGPELSLSLPRSCRSVPADLSVSCLASVPFLTSALLQESLFPQTSSMLVLKCSCLSPNPPRALAVYRAHPPLCVLLLLASFFLLIDHCQPTIFITLISEPQIGSFSTNAQCPVDISCALADQPGCSSQATVGSVFSAVVA